MLLEAFLLRLLMAGIGITFLFIGNFLLLRLADKAAGIKFRKSFDKVEESALALSIYYGLRWLGICIATGMVVCAAIVL